MRRAFPRPAARPARPASLPLAPGRSGSGRSGRGRLAPRLLAPCLLVLAACGSRYSPDTYAPNAVQQASKVEQGVIIGVRKVAVEASGATGAVSGAAAGAAVGSQGGGGGVGTALTAIGGSLVGGLLGAGAERAVGDTFAYEYIVRKPSKELVSVTQRDRAPLALGAKVLVIAGPQARIVPDYTTPPEPKPSFTLIPAEPPPDASRDGGGPPAPAAPAAVAPASVTPAPDTSVSAAPVPAIPVPAIPVPAIAAPATPAAAAAAPAAAEPAPAPTPGTEGAR